MSRLSSGGATFTWEGELTETTEVTVQRPGGEPETIPYSRAVAMTNGAILEAEVETDATPQFRGPGAWYRQAAEARERAIGHG